MYFSSLSTVLLIGTASSVGATFAGQHSSRSALAELESLFGRQTTFCAEIPPPYTCERSCGPGYITCIALPTCYNPSIGETCCSNGDYCTAGTYCTDAGCCDDGLTLAECGATVSLSVIPPPATSAAASSSSSAAPSTTSSTSTTSTSSKSVASTTKSSTSTSTTSATSTTALSTTKSNLTSTSSPAQFTPGSSAANNRNSLLVSLVLGGLGVFLLL